MKREDLRVWKALEGEEMQLLKPVTDADLAALLPEIIESVGQAAVVDYLADNGDGTWSIKNWVTKRGLAVADAAYGSVIEIPNERLAALGYVRLDVDVEALLKVQFMPEKEMDPPTPIRPAVLVGPSAEVVHDLIRQMLDALEREET